MIPSLEEKGRVLHPFLEKLTSDVQGLFCSILESVLPFTITTDLMGSSHWLNLSWEGMPVPLP